MTETGARRVESAFRRIFGRPSTFLARAPGRIVLLGAHIDSSQCCVLPATIEPAIYLAAAPNAGKRLRMHALDLDAPAELELENLPRPLPERLSAIAWTDYPAGVAWVLGQQVDELPGLDLVFGGDLWPGSGLSSSAAVEVALILAFDFFCGLDLDRAAIAGLGHRVEVEFLGLKSGVMDQMACLAGQADHAVLIDCRTLATEALRLPPNLSVVIFDSGVHRRLVGSGFNNRRAELEQALGLLRQFLPELATLRDLKRSDFESLRSDLPPPLDRRVLHVLDERDRVLEGADLLRRGTIEGLGALINASQESSRALFEVSIPEIDHLCASLGRCEGVRGARLMGGGFGGAVAAWVEKPAVPEVVEQVAASFEKSFGYPTKSLVTGLTSGAGRISP